MWVGCLPDFMFGYLILDLDFVEDSCYYHIAGSSQVYKYEATNLE